MKKNNLPINLCLSCFLLLTVIFVIDLQLPLGVAGGVPYVAVIILSLWFKNKKYIFGLAVICTILTLIGYYFSPMGGEAWKVIVNRGLAILVVWTTAILAIKWENTQIQAELVALNYNKILEKQIDLRTNELNEKVRELKFHKLSMDEHSIVSITDVNGIITYVNQKFCNISGFSEEELIGQSHRITSSKEHPKEFYSELWETISSGKVWQGTIKNHKKNGGYYWTDLTITPFLDDNGKPFQYVAVRTDITEQIDAVNAAEKANNAKSDFLSSMSHELRTPLNAILGFSQLLEINEDDEEKKKNIKEIIDAGHHLLNLIEEILDLSKIESGNLKLYIEKHDLNEILNNVLTLIHPIADKHSIQINNKVNASFNINVDEMRFKQVLLNLLSNSIKYNSENGQVIIDSFTDNNMLQLSISDTGKGLTPEQLSTAFQPFDRAGAENSNIEGAGLGLKISKELLESMGGMITVESEAGKGSRFIIHIPLL